MTARTASWSGSTLGHDTLPGQRLHHLNDARTLLMLLGIPYHAALLFQDQIRWAAAAGTVSPVATFIVGFIHVFRMPAFFLLSGYLAAAVLMNADGVAWLKRRYVALGIPLVCALVLLNPLQILVPMILNGEVSDSPFRGQGVGHLWFLFALLGIAPIALLLRRPLMNTGHLSATALAIGSCVGIAVTLGVADLAREMLSAAEFPYRNTVVSIVWGICWGLPFFLLGMLTMYRKDVAHRLCSRTPLANGAILIAVIAYALVVPLRIDTTLPTVIAGILAVPIATTIMFTPVGSSRQRSPYAEMANQSSFTVYLVHHPIVIILGALTSGLPVAWYVHYALICVCTAILSFGFWYAIRNVSGLNLLFGAVRFRSSGQSVPSIA